MIGRAQHQGKIDGKAMAVHAQMGSGVLLAIWGIANILDRGTLGNLSNPLVVGYGLLKLLGLGMGSILLWYEVDRYNPVLQGFCSGDKKVNCDSVLNSRYSKMSNGPYEFDVPSQLWPSRPITRERSSNNGADSVSRYS